MNTENRLETAQVSASLAHVILTGLSLLIDSSPALIAAMHLTALMTQTTIIPLFYCSDSSSQYETAERILLPTALSVMITAPSIIPHIR